MTGMDHLLEYFKTKDEEHFKEGITSIKGLIYTQVGKYGLYFNAEEIYQEASIKLWKGLKNNYDPEKKDIFGYVLMVVERTIKNHIRKINALKRKFLKDAAPLDREYYDSEDDYYNIIAGYESAEEEVVCNLEFQRLSQKFYKRLSPMEKKVYLCMIEDVTKIEDMRFIEKETGFAYKQIDNAIQRIRTKAKTFIEEEKKHATRSPKRRKISRARKVFQ